MDEHKKLSRGGSERKFKGRSRRYVRKNDAPAHRAPSPSESAPNSARPAGEAAREQHYAGAPAHRFFSRRKNDERAARRSGASSERKDTREPARDAFDTPKAEAERLGAEHEFGAKYPDMVSVYSVGPEGASEEDPQFGRSFSIESFAAARMS